MNVPDLLTAVMMVVTLLVTGLYVPPSSTPVVLCLAATVILFSVAVARACVDGVEAARRADPRDGEKTARSAFWDVVRGRIRFWAVLWFSFVVALEAILFTVVGGGNLVLTLPAAGVALLTVPTALGLLEVTRRTYVLAVLAIVLPVSLFVGSSFGALWVMDTFDLGTGYMDLGLAFGPPLVAGVVLAAVGIGLGVLLRRRDEGWYRELAASGVKPEI